MSKFETNLSKNADEVKKQRAKIITEETAACQTDLVNKYQAEKRQLELKLLNLSDVSPDNTYSLRPAGPSYDAQKWVNEMQNLKFDLLANSVNLQIALKTQEEWFKDEKK